MGDDLGDPLFPRGRGLLRVVQNGRHPVGDQTPVLHSPSSEVRDSDHVCGGIQGMNEQLRVRLTKWNSSREIMIIMYIYHALINALSAHMIHINLNVIFYTHVEHSPTKTIYIKYYIKKLKTALQTHPHTPTPTH